MFLTYFWFKCSSRISIENEAFVKKPAPEMTSSLILNHIWSTSGFFKIHGKPDVPYQIDWRAARFGSKFDHTGRRLKIIDFGVVSVAFWPEIGGGETGEVWIGDVDRLTELQLVYWDICRM